MPYIQLVTYRCTDAPFTGVLKNFRTSAKHSGHTSKFPDISEQLLKFREFRDNAQACSSINSVKCTEFHKSSKTLSNKTTDCRKTVPCPTSPVQSRARLRIASNQRAENAGRVVDHKCPPNHAGSVSFLPFHTVTNQIRTTALQVVAKFHRGAGPLQPSRLTPVIGPICHPQKLLLGAIIFRESA